MERLIAAQKTLEEATKREEEVFKKLLQAANEEDDEGMKRVYPKFSNAVLEKSEAKRKVEEIRNEVLSECVTKRDVQIKTKKWTDQNGVEHTFEYVVV